MMHALTRVKTFFLLALSPIGCLVKHASLFKGFVGREIRGRFAGSMGGIAWTLIHPVALIGVYTFVFSIVIRIQVTQEETGTDTFLIFFLTGLLPWLIFSDSVSRATSSLIGNADLITKVVFPVELLPTSAMIAATTTNGIGFVLFLGYLSVAGYASLHWLFILPLFAVHMLFTWGVSLFLSALCVFIRDIQELIGLVLMVWFFSTPIIYPVSFVPEWIRDYILYNPMATLILAYRGVILQHQFHPFDFMIFGLTALVFFAFGSWFFMRVKSAFGDVL